MWVLTPLGFFSAVQSPDAVDVIVVRARVRADLERLREELLVKPPIKSGEGTDYPYRMRLRRSDWMAACSVMAMDVNYPNFKDAVKERQGERRAGIYSRVWAVLLGLEEWSPPPGPLGRHLFK